MPGWRNLARKQHEDFQLVLTRYAIERLLYRLTRTGYAAEFVLKGAMLFRLWADQPHRPTRDLDLLGRGDPSVDRLAAVFRAVCGAAVEDDGLLFDPATVTAGKIKEDQEYEGVRVECVARLGQARIDLQVDVGFGDAVTPGPVTVQYPGLLDLPAPELAAYPRETVVAEKFQAMVMLGIANSRMKDFFDLWVLARSFTFAGPVLAAAIRATFARRKTPGACRPAPRPHHRVRDGPGEGDAMGGVPEEGKAGCRRGGAGRGVRVPRRVPDAAGPGPRRRGDVRSDVAGGRAVEGRPLNHVRPSPCRLILWQTPSRARQSGPGIRPSK